MREIRTSGSVGFGWVITRTYPAIAGKFESQQSVTSLRTWLERVEPRMRLLFFPFRKQFSQDFHESRNIVFRDEPYPFNKDFPVFMSEYISLTFYLPPGKLGMFIQK
jgi:hypothetical protein